MSDDSIAYERPRPPRERRWYWRIIRFPLTRILIGGPVIYIAAYLPFSIVLALYGVTADTVTGGQMMLAAAAALPGPLLLYWLLVRFIEWRPMTELSLRGAATELGVGVLAGFGLLASVIGLIALADGYHITGTNPPSVLLFPFAISVLSGFVEEIITRGLLYRILEESLGTWIATLISAMIFGFLHLGNDNATVISSLSIALSAGPLLAWAYIITRRLWICMGLHFAWNFALGGIFGAPVSGNDIPGILQAELTGPELISGGAFGPEASIITVILAVILSAAFYIIAARRGHIVRPFWRRTRKPPVDAAP